MPASPLPLAGSTAGLGGRSLGCWKQQLFIKCLACRPVLRMLSAVGSKFFTSVLRAVAAPLGTSSWRRRALGAGTFLQGTTGEN